MLCLPAAGKNQAMYGTSPVKITFGETVGLSQTGDKQPKTSRECVSIYL
jgi:hypothetical protein